MKGKTRLSLSSLNWAHSSLISADCHTTSIKIHCIAYLVGTRWVVCGAMRFLNVRLKIRPFSLGATDFHSSSCNARLFELPDLLRIWEGRRSASPPSDLLNFLSRYSGKLVASGYSINYHTKISQEVIESCSSRILWPIALCDYFANSQMPFCILDYLVFAPR